MHQDSPSISVHLAKEHTMSNYTASVCTEYPLDNAKLEDGFCAGTVPVDVSQARSILALNQTDFLFLERGTGSVVLVQDLDGDSIPESRRILVQANSLNHGLELTDTHITLPGRPTSFVGRTIGRRLPSRGSEKRWWKTSMPMEWVAPLLAIPRGPW